MLLACMSVGSSCLNSVAPHKTVASWTPLCQVSSRNAAVGLPFSPQGDIRPGDQIHISVSALAS